MPSATPTFGKRNAPRRLDIVAVSTPLELPEDQAAFFAAVRTELADTAETRRVDVPRSFKAAFLAGLVVGCALVGFDVTGGVGAREVERVAALAGVQIDTHTMLPALILLGLFGGARVAALTIIFAHTMLARAGYASHVAYAFGGMAAAGALAGVSTALGHPPAHGWAIELAAAASAGLLYRIFAGTRVKDA